MADLHGQAATDRQTLAESGGFGADHNHRREGIPDLGNAAAAGVS